MTTTSPQPLLYHRRSALLSQRDLADKAGVTASTIYLIESGRSPDPKLKTMRLVADALGVSAADITEFRESLRRQLHGR